MKSSLVFALSFAVAAIATPTLETKSTLQDHIRSLNLLDDGYIKLHKNGLLESRNAAHEVIDSIHLSDVPASSLPARDTSPVENVIEQKKCVGKRCIYVSDCKKIGCSACVYKDLGGNHCDI